MKKMIMAVAMMVAIAASVFAEVKVKDYGYGKLMVGPAGTHLNNFHMFEVEDTLPAKQSLSHATYYKAMSIAHDIPAGQMGIIGVYDENGKGTSWMVINLEGTLYQLIKKAQ